MKSRKLKQKNICKNGQVPASKKYISPKWQKTPCIAAIWGRHYAGKSDKESSHVVGKVDGVYILSHLDGDIARLIRFKEGIRNQTGRFEILCFPHQTHFLQEYMGRLVSIKTIDMDAVEAELCPERRNLFGG